MPVRSELGEPQARQRAALPPRQSARAVDLGGQTADTKAKLADFVRKEVCGLANRRGGYLLLGAEDENDGWVLSGIDVPGVRELHDWIASLLRQLEPTPLFDVHEWRLNNRRKLVVVQVEPASLTPISFNGTVYLRHGTQTIRADGPAIRRLSEHGAKEERRLSKLAERHAKSFADQLWTPFGLAVARSGDRLQALSDVEPARVASEELERSIRSRWPRRRHQRLVWGGDDEKHFGDLGFNAPAPPRAWRVAWQVKQQPTKPAVPRRRHRSLGTRLKRDLTIGDEDIWLSYLFPHNLAAGSLFLMPIRQRPIEHEYGDRAIGNAALLLSSLIATELRLGASPDERAYVCLALKEWGSRETLNIGRLVDMTQKPVEWRRDVTAEAARKMHL